MAPTSKSSISDQWVHSVAPTPKSSIFDQWVLSSGLQYLPKRAATAAGNISGMPEMSPEISGISGISGKISGMPEIFPAAVAARFGIYCRPE